MKDLMEKHKIQNKKKEGGEKDRLLDLLIHDLTGPLSIASTSANSLLQKAGHYGSLNDQQKRILERILRNVQKSQTLIQEMIEIFHSEEKIFQKDFFSVEKTLRESLLDVLEMNFPHLVEKLRIAVNQEEFQNLLVPQGIFIEITGKYSESLFCHDQRKIQQILRNLLSNAIKFRRHKVNVAVSGEKQLMIMVEDDGIGISQEDQEFVFERFVRVNRKRYPFVPGLGLGLTGVKSLVEAMEGEIKLVSREGSGTRFIVQIPAL